MPVCEYEQGEAEDQVRLLYREREPLHWLTDEPSEDVRTVHQKFRDWRSVKTALYAGTPGSEFDKIVDVINASRTITDLQDNWDEEGSVGYSRTTWQRATDFLLEEAEIARDQFRALIGIPRVTPAEKGSIDIYWKDEDRTLLINIPADIDSRATFYGQNAEGGTISGAFSLPVARPDLVAWLLK